MSQATDQIRNQLNSQIDSLIERGKAEIKNQAKRKVDELKAKIPTPQELLQKLKAEINNDSCSEEGKEKFMKIYRGIIGTMTDIENVIGRGVETLEGVENTIKPIIEQKGPVGKIQEFATTIQPIIESLKFQFDTGCELLDDGQNTSTGGTNVGFPPEPNGPTPLQNYQNAIKDYYANVYNALLAAGNTKVIERIFVIEGSDGNYSEATINSNFLNSTIGYNISFKVKDISSIDPTNPSGTIFEETEG